MKVLFDVLMGFDFMVALYSLTDDIRNDFTLFRNHSWSFFVPSDSSWSAADVSYLLRKRGVKIYGANISNEAEYMFSVPIKQARWAEHILNEAGVPMTESSEGATGGPAEFDFVLSYKEGKE